MLSLITQTPSSTLSFFKMTVCISALPGMQSNQKGMCREYCMDIFLLASCTAPGYYLTSMPTPWNMSCGLMMWLISGVAWINFYYQPDQHLYSQLHIDTIFHTCIDLGFSIILQKVPTCPINIFLGIEINPNCLQGIITELQDTTDGDVTTLSPRGHSIHPWKPLLHVQCILPWSYLP